MFQTFFDGFGAPRLIFDRCFTFRFNSLSEIDQPFGCVRAAIKQDVFDALAEFGLDLLVNGKLPRIDDSHVEAGADRVKQKCRVHCFADGVVPAK